jgi:transcriptional regulator with XRE-family HTH domain
MDLLEKIDRLMLVKGVNRAELARGADIPYTTIRGLYEKGFEHIRITTLQKLADYFDVSLDFLVRDIEPAAFPLTDHEKELVALFRALNDQGQTVLLKNARAYAADPDYAQSPPVPASVS